MAVLLQVAAARGSDTVPGALRAMRRSAVFFVASCLIVMVTHDTIGWVTIALIWLGHVTVTGAELFESAAAWGFASECLTPSGAANPGSQPARLHGGLGVAAGGVHLFGDQLGHHRLADHRRDRRRWRGGRGSGRAGGGALPGDPHEPGARNVIQPFGRGLGALQSGPVSTSWPLWACPSPRRTPCPHRPA